MTATLHRLASARAAKRPRKKLTDAQKYARALRQQQPLEDWERELDAAIGIPGDAA